MNSFSEIFGNFKGGSASAGGRGGTLGKGCSRFAETAETAETNSFICRSEGSSTPAARVNSNSVTNFALNFACLCFLPCL